MPPKLGSPHGVAMTSMHAKFSAREQARRNHHFSSDSRTLATPKEIMLVSLPSATTISLCHPKKLISFPCDRQVLLMGRVLIPQNREVAVALCLLRLVSGLYLSFRVDTATCVINRAEHAKNLSTSA